MDFTKTSDYFFDLPEELIAQTPLEERSCSKFLVMDKKTGELKDDIFKNVVNYLQPGDVLVMNNTKVLPARLFGYKDSGAKVEFLLIERVDANRWKTMVKPGKKALPGTHFRFSEELEAKVLEVVEEGLRLIEFNYVGNFENILDRIGQMPLPPYITEKLNDKDRYQTVFAKHSGSSAAPTAGLHFTPELIEQIKDKGIIVEYVTLHVGLGTFRPVKVENILEHKMHSERYSIDQKTVDSINDAKARGNKVIAVGTTSTRTLEGVFKEHGALVACEGDTDIFIYPGYEFNVVDSIITNFHLPESTLIMLISAFASRDMVLRAYKHAIENKYRFFSFGDSMMIK